MPFVLPTNERAAVPPGRRLRLQRPELALASGDPRRQVSATGEALWHEAPHLVGGLAAPITPAPTQAQAPTPAPAPAPAPTPAPAPAPASYASLRRPNWRRVQSHWWKPTPRLFGAHSARGVRVGLELEMEFMAGDAPSAVLAGMFDDMDRAAIACGHRAALVDADEAIHGEADGSLSSSSSSVEVVTAALPAPNLPVYCRAAAERNPAWSQARAAWLGLDAAIGRTTPEPGGRKPLPINCTRQWENTGLHCHMTRPTVTSVGSELAKPTPFDDPRLACHELHASVHRHLYYNLDIIVASLGGFTNTYGKARDRFAYLVGRKRSAGSEINGPGYWITTADSERLRFRLEATNNDQVFGKTSTSRYHAINHNNSKTIEFRCFGGGPLVDPDDPNGILRNWHRTVPEIALALFGFAEAITRRQAYLAAELPAACFGGAEVIDNLPTQGALYAIPDVIPIEVCEYLARGRESVAHGRRPIFDAVHGSMSPADRIGTGDMWLLFHAWCKAMTPCFDLAVKRIEYAMSLVPIT